MKKQYSFVYLVLFFTLGHFVSIYLNINTLVLFFIIFLLFFILLKFKFTSIFISILLGMANANIFLYPNISNENLAFYNLDEKFLTLEGIVINKTNYKYSQNLEIDLVNVYKNYYRRKIKGKISLLNKSSKLLNFGDRLIFRAKLSKTKKEKNYGGFNLQSYLKLKNIYYSAIIKKSRDIRIISSNNLNFFTKVKLKIKDNLLNRIKDKDVKGFYSSILLGDKRFLNKTLKNNMISLGIMHLFAISGFHISLLFMIIYFIILFLSRLSIKVVKKVNIQKFSLVFSIIFIVFYLYLIDFQTSATRATIMISIFSLSKIFEKRFNSINILALSAVIILLLEKGSFLKIGFYLSFIAVLAFIIPINYFNSKVKNNFFYKYIIVNIVLFLITAPILLFSFYKISFAQLIFNIFYIPFFTFIIYPLALISTVLSQFMNVNFIYNNLYFLFNYISEFFSGDYFIYAPINKIQLILSLIAILSFLMFIKTNNKKILFVSLLYFTILIPNNRFDGLNIYFMYVGNGDAILIQDEDDVILIDAGSSMSGKNGRNVIKPHLDYLGIRKIDYAILTHQDEDHYGGLSYLAKEKRIKKIYSNIYLNKELKDIEKLYEIIDDKKVIRTKNTKITLYASLFFDDKNSNSIITLLEYKGYKFLFTGDADKKRELLFIAQNPEIKDINVLKAGHHGSRTSSSREFLKRMKPKLTIFSSGIDNRFKHPHKEVLDNMNNLNLKYLRTDKCGEIHLNIKDNISVNTLLSCKK